MSLSLRRSKSSRINMFVCPLRVGCFFFVARRDTILYPGPASSPNTIQNLELPLLCGLFPQYDQNVMHFQFLLALRSEYNTFGCLFMPCGQNAIYLVVCFMQCCQNVISYLFVHTMRPECNTFCVFYAMLPECNTFLWAPRAEFYIVLTPCPSLSNRS
jgi:hypothetical protein